MDQVQLPGTEDPWMSEERIKPKSGRPLTLRYVLVQTEDALDRMVEVASAARDISHDTETSGLVPALGARAIGHAVACQTAPSEITMWYVPIRHILTSEPQLPIERVSQAIEAILTSPGRCVWAHGKFDWAMNRADSIRCTREAIDVLIEANIANENEPSFALKALAEKYVFEGARTEEGELDEWMRKDARKLGLKYKSRGANSVEEVNTLGEPTYLERFGYSRTPIRLCGRYACKDVFYNLYLALVTYRDIPVKFADVYRREHRTAQCLHMMEWVGLPIDEARVREVHENTGEQVLHWLGEVRRLANDPELLPTDDNLRALLYEKLGMVAPKWTGGGKSGKKKRSVDREARELLKRQYPPHAELIEALSRLTDASKYHTTYSGNFLRYLDPATGRMHPSYNQLERRDKGVPVTGRLSSANPNVQNIAWKPLTVDTPDGEHFKIAIREYFTVPKGFVRAYIDFSQIELRVLAWFCQDKNLLRAYQQGLDVHQMTADLLGIDRKVAKQVNFGNSYGMTEIGLALRMPGYYDDPKGTIEEARKVLDAFFARYAAIKAFERRLAAHMKRNNNSFVNPFGRPRRIEWISEFERWKRNRAQRQMMSSIISGTAADLMKECMIKSVDILTERSPESRLVQSVHDELVFDLRNEPGWTSTLAAIIRMMEDWPMFSEAGPEGRGEGVPIRVSCELTTTTWEDKREIELLEDGNFQWAA
jgi:DNA polymerase-1